ncbi:helix-turn-helix transcriptional regulator [Sphingobacterium bambusae]|uniref:Helix-turn-helix transcriptional regulator n=1 Tax=Sphingobacterium bambusae TaxID=662858 RepID=A0ABW6BH37_9SPHI|nr:helix-turn-helix transcriptional regulator [Sphingobacterium bambusae]WPL49411.1 helix-turn-helix transcriptional regulator [Sphingobacterium bambusae]
MIQKKVNHVGQNIRKIRLLRGMKQDTFAKHMGIAQQNVSKMENKKNISDEQLQKVSKILKASVESIKDFDENTIINNNILNDQVNNYNIHPLEKVVELLKGVIESKDSEIEKLKGELDALLKHRAGDVDSTDNFKVFKVKGGE